MLLETRVANDNKLMKVSDPATILCLLTGAKELGLEVFAWRLIGSQKLLGSVRIEAVRKQRNDFSIVPLAGSEQVVKDLLGGQNFVDLYIPASSLLFRCNVKTTDAPVRYYLQFPEFVAQVERRKSFRLNVYGTGEVKASFAKAVATPKPGTQHFSKDLFDISTGGFSFFVARLETKLFQLGDEIPQVTLKAGSWTGKLAAKVTMIREVDPDEHNGLQYKVWRVSCKFSAIDEVSRKYLQVFIFERMKHDLHAMNI